MKKHQKNNNKQLLIISSVIAVLAVVGIIFYVAQRTSNQSNTPSGKHCTTGNGAIEEQCAEDYIGLKRSDAVKKAIGGGLLPKIAKIDGKSAGHTDEGGIVIYFEVENDHITKAYFEEDRPL